jgi:hypothetical protein
MKAYPVNILRFDTVKEDGAPGHGVFPGFRGGLNRRAAQKNREEGSQENERGPLGGQARYISPY